MAHQQFRVLLNYTATPATPVHYDNTFVSYTCTQFGFIGERVSKREMNSVAFTLADALIHSDL